LKFSDTLFPKVPSSPIKSYIFFSSFLKFSVSKDEILKRVGFYVKHKFIDEKLENQLKEIADLIQNLNDAKSKRDKLYSERDTMTDEQNRLRENISVLGEDNQSVSLKERYIKKLDDQESRFEAISSELKKYDKDITNLNKQIEEKINKVKV